MIGGAQPALWHYTAFPYVHIAYLGVCGGRWKTPTLLTTPCGGGWSLARGWDFYGKYFFIASKEGKIKKNSRVDR